MRALVAFTMKSMETRRPVPFGSSVVDTTTGKLLARSLNRVALDHDPSAHAEVCAIRLATKRRGSHSLVGYTLYTTCEPCPMCMSAALWAGIDRVVYGVTIAQCRRHCRQIAIGAREVSERSDMATTVDGPILGRECYRLFTHPAMLRAFVQWTTSRTEQKEDSLRSGERR